MKKVLLVGAVAASLLLSLSAAQASSGASCNSFSHTCSAFDTHTRTIEPIETRSSDAVVYSTDPEAPAPNHLDNANIQSYSLTVSGGTLTAVLHMKGPLVLDPTSAATQIAPYTGQHVLVLFQTSDLQNYGEQISTSATGTPVTWGDFVNGSTYLADGFRWELLFGWSTEGNTNGPSDCNAGFYDPTGNLSGIVGAPVNLPIFFGQSFVTVGQQSITPTNPAPPNTTCSVSSDHKTVTISQPYQYEWWGGSTATPQKFTKYIVHSGETVKNVSAFSWLDEPVAEGPQPIGLILGWTWYTDWLPQNSYRIGTIAGDPNPNKFMGPKCITNSPLIGGDPVTGPPGPCTTNNPIGAGFVDTGNAVTAG
ncbi:MAG: hypothetical protein ACYDCC_01775 [Actinomycetota bacterium]